MGASFSRLIWGGALRRGYSPRPGDQGLYRRHEDPQYALAYQGVLNLRGTIVPIIELRTKFNMQTIDYTAFTVIIVVVVRDKVMGLVVDAVSDVLNIDKKDIQPPPQFGAKVDVSFLNGIGKSNDKLVALLDMDRLLLDDEMQDGTKAPKAA